MTLVITEDHTLVSAPQNQTTPAPGHLKFGPNDGFHLELRRRVDQFFDQTGRRRRDCPRMYLKSAVVLSWLVASYVLLVFYPGSWWTALPLAISMGLSMAAVGFNIQHDGNHGAYSDHRWVNKLMAMTLDLLGASSYVWTRKHNAIHHSYTNVTGHDDDINVGFLGRLSPHQKHLKIHRVQHYYLWALYGLLPIKWQLFDDFHNVIINKIGNHRLVRPKGLELLMLLIGKAFFFSFAFVIPMLLHPIWVVLLFYGIASLAQGITLSVVFQMAHCVEEAEFPMPREETGRIENTWAVHQVETTVDFARNNRMISWFAGGLNYQIEHHLFPQVCHIHYPALAPVVENTCKEYGVRYIAHPTFSSGIASHFRWLRRMGKAQPA